LPAEEAVSEIVRDPGAQARLAAPPPSESRGIRVVRRGVDIAASIAALVATAPVVAAAAVVVRLDTPGPPFFRQVRLGLGGRPFRILKLRGMYVDARKRFGHLYDYELDPEEARNYYFHLEDDPRVTRAGRFFRRTSVDELPNFWNVLVGDMTLVGPRPQIPELFAYYGPYRDVVLSVKPGIFSLPKVLYRDEVPLETTVLADAYYVHHRSLAFDARILVRGVAAALRRHGVR
jgi:lipopolysaccharide/colanic/teichoic acid biosynthesis glycosyltransferase